MPCRYASCAQCYKDDQALPFKVNRAFNDEAAYYRRRKEDTNKYLVARDGDWTITPFQCDKCWFVNIYGRLPSKLSLSDGNVLATIRRANLDIFWSREYRTVKSTVGSLKEIVRRAKEAGRPMPLDTMEPWPVSDREGMGMAIMMLEKSLEKGRNDGTYMQYDTCRKLRSAAFNVFSATTQGNSKRFAMKSKDGRVAHMFQGSTQSLLMERFALGMKSRMPQKSKRNKALVAEVVADLLNRMEEELVDPETSPERKRELSMAGGYIAVTFGYSLRGNEGFWVDAERLVASLHLGRAAGNDGHVVISLLGRFKGEEGDRMHVFALANVTRSGIRIRAWLERVARLLQTERKTQCPAFCDEEGYMLSSSDIEGVFHPYLKEMQEEDRYAELIPRGLTVEENYLCFRSFRRGAEVTALNQKVEQTVIEFVHRWSKFEKSQGKVPGFNMLEHYAEGARMRPTQILFSASL